MNLAGRDDQDEYDGGNRHEQIHACTCPCQHQVGYAQWLAQKASRRFR